MLSAGDYCNMWRSPNCQLLVAWSGLQDWTNKGRRVVLGINRQQLAGRCRTNLVQYLLPWQMRGLEPPLVHRAAWSLLGPHGNHVKQQQN